MLTPWREKPAAGCGAKAVNLLRVMLVLALCGCCLLAGACKHTAGKDQEQQLAEMMDGAGGMRLELIHHFVMHGNYDAAIPMIRMALKQDPNNASAYYYHGLILMEKHQDELARQALLRVLEIQPDFSQAMDRLGVLSGRLGNTGEAIRWHQAAIDTRGDDPVYHNNLGYTLFVAGKPEESVVAYQRAVNLDPSNRVTYNNLGFVYGRLERFSAARRAFEQVGSPLATEMNMGLVYRLTGRWEEAARCYEAALLLSPGSEEAQAGLREVVSVIDGGRGQDPVPVVEKDWPLDGGGVGGGGPAGLSSDNVALDVGPGDGVRREVQVIGGVEVVGGGDVSVEAVTRGENGAGGGEE